MAEEHDSWLGGLGVNVENFLGSVAQKAEDTVSSAARTVYDAGSSVVEKAEEVGSGVVQKVEETGSSVVQKVEKTASGAWNTAKDYGSKAVKGAKEAGSAAWDTAKDVGEEVVEGVEDAGSAVVEEVEDAGSAVVQGVKDAASATWDTAKEVGEDIVDGAEEVVEDVEDAGSAIVEGVKEAGSAAWDTAKEVGGVVVEGVEEVVDEVEDTASDLYQKGKKLAGEALKVATDPDQYSGIQTPIRKKLEEVAADGHPVAPRPLSSAELADAKAIFGSSLDYSKIIVDGGSVASLGASRTIGNTVHLTPDLFVPGSSDTTTEGRRTLVHELTHVWQYQHDGWTYAPKALWAQAKAAVKGDRNGAYDWEPLVKKGIPWDEWNPEAQAEAVEDYNKALHNAHDGTATKKDYSNLTVLKKYVDALAATPAA